ncbi:Protein of unknown function (Hypoth_ymh) [Geopseudomonas sagittaria]|uniref:Conserved hypothetical protein CHP02391 domain-containing protein n=1 Tax=Geopseudomonas sagittaria TaxID=1135990 RepID=A0A1I5PX98_9GAMM|nr:TIGR02391 family protein [Pseudomonas sagittaria]SFP38499.1 Protein of unknown function (Hypoth_ymh) [Pseudomonas sagittaria]
MSGVAQISQYQEAYKIALSMHRQFEDLDAPALLILLDSFERIIIPLVKSVDPKWDHCGSLGRHMNFLRKYLPRGYKQLCVSDAFDVVYYDLPILADYLISEAGTPGHIDPRLFEATNRLFDIQDYASVIRAAFPVLSARLRLLFGVSPGSDGEGLVNAIFARGEGDNPVVLSTDAKTAYRNLLAGFYATYRNRLNHDDFQPTLTQAKGVVEMTNSLIKDLEEVAEASAAHNLI